MKLRSAALLLLCASACWVPVERGQQMEARIAKLEGESKSASKALEEQRAALKERVAAADTKIAEVQTKLDQLNATAHRTGADLAVNQDKLQDEVARLRGVVEELSHKLDGIDQQLAQQRTDTDARFAALKGSGALEEYEAKRKLESVPRPEGKGAFFGLAREKEQAGDRAEARELYDEFTKKWPSDPHAADAYFRIGEILFGDKRYREAILAYGKVAQDFPRSDKAPDALLRTGESMLALDLKDDATQLFQEVVRRYPKTTAAQRAKARLSELGGSRKKPKAKP